LISTIRLLAKQCPVGENGGIMNFFARASMIALVGSAASCGAGCSSGSSNPAPTGPGASAATSGGSGGSSATGSGGSRSPSGNDAGKGNPDSGPTSKQCADYCDCYQTKCSVFVAIPTGQPCTDFCATFTPDQYDCRFAMCFYNSNGPTENNNDHCQHTVGINECL
jgi:hypothetical protein